MDFRDLECRVCSNLFSDDCCPINLPCSHTFCSRCINRIISSKSKICPVCRANFIASSAKDLMINRIALNMAKQLSFRDLKTCSSGTKESIGDFVNQFKEKMDLSHIQRVEEETVSVLAYINTLKDDTLKFRREIQMILNQLDELLNNINNDTEMWRINLAVIRNGKEKVQDLCEKLDKMSTYTSAGLVMDEAEEVLQDVQRNIKEHPERFQKNEIRRQSVKQVILDANAETSKIASQMKKRIEEFEKDIIKVNDLKGLLDLLSWKSQREIIAVQDYKGKQKVATLKIEAGNRVHLSNFKEEILPTKCFVVQVDPVRAYSPRRAFLDLALDDGTPLGKIVIKVKDESNFALNFLHVCAGDLGSSYANSWVGVADRGKRGEFMSLEGYNVGSGMSNEAVLSGIDWEGEVERDIYNEAFCVAGQVWAWSALPHFASKFRIITRADPSIGTFGCFGVVEEGLNVLKNAILYYPQGRKMKILNSGLVFSL